MTSYYRTKTGDTLDWICWQYYAREINLGSAAMAVDPKLLENNALLESGFLLGPQSDDGLRGQVEAVLAANPELSAYPPDLPAGLSIFLPELNPASGQDTVVKLWD